MVEPIRGELCTPGDMYNWGQVAFQRPLGHPDGDAQETAGQRERVNRRDGAGQQRIGRRQMKS